MCKNIRKIYLVTNFDNEENQTESLGKLTEIKQSLSERNISLDVIVNPNMHDRLIKLNSGWVIKIGRGFDIYQKVKSNFSIGFCDFELRPTLETTIDIMKV